MNAVSEIKQEAELLQLLSMELMVWVIAPAFLITLWMFGKTRFLNWKAGAQIKMDTDFDLHNDFFINGRHAMMWKRNSQFVTIFYYDTGQTQKIGNREFIHADIFETMPKAESWSKEKREAFRAFLAIDNGGHKSKEK